MFERFTAAARLAVVYAQDVANQLHSSHVDTQHLLVALIEAHGTLSDTLRAAGLDPGDVAGRARAAITAADALDGAALASLGIDLEAVRASTDRWFGKGSLDAAARPRRSSPKGHVPFTADAKKALELSLREAIRLKQKSIDPRHLLLGILRAESPGGRVLAGAAAEAGLELPVLRLALERPADAAA